MCLLNDRMLGAPSRMQGPLHFHDLDCLFFSARLSSPLFPPGKALLRLQNSVEGTLFFTACPMSLKKNSDPHLYWD